MAAHILTQELLKSQLHYNPETGIFTWIVKRANLIAGCTDSSGHVQIKVNGTLYLAHRLAALYMNGNFPDRCIDHINGIKTDNSWANLRIATRYQNGYNIRITKTNTSGVRGVSWSMRDKKWVARCSVEGKRYSLGYYDDIELARNARNEFAKTHHGNFFIEC